MFPYRVFYVVLLELYMRYFDIILGMDLFYTSFASIGCRTRIVKINFPKEPNVEWKVRNSIPRGRIISCLKAYKMISTGCLYHIVRVQDLYSEILSIESVRVASEFRRSFLMTFLVFPRMEN